MMKDTVWVCGRPEAEVAKTFDGFGPRNLTRPAPIHSPGRPEELHLQPPTEQCVSLSTYTARPSHPLATSRGQADAQSPCSSQFPGWHRPSLSRDIPFAPLSLQKLHRYYRMIRPRHVHRYFPPSWFALIGFSLRITCRVPKFLVRACIRVTPPEHRTPHGQ